MVDMFLGDLYPGLICRASAWLVLRTPSVHVNVPQ